MNNSGASVGVQWGKLLLVKLLSHIMTLVSEFHLFYFLSSSVLMLLGKCWLMVQVLEFLPLHGRSE